MERKGPERSGLGPEHDGERGEVSKPGSVRNTRLEIPLTMELRSLMRPLPTPYTEAIDDNLPSELQLNRLAYKLHRGRCDPKRGVMSRLRSP